MTDDQSPVPSALQQAVGKLNEGVSALANGATAIPGAIARDVAASLHGQAKVQEALGQFDPEPVTTMVDRLKSQNPSNRAR